MRAFAAATLSSVKRVFLAKRPSDYVVSALLISLSFALMSLGMVTFRKSSVPRDRPPPSFDDPLFSEVEFRIVCIAEDGPPESAVAFVWVTPPGRWGSAPVLARKEGFWLTREESEAEFPDADWSALDALLKSEAAKAVK